MSGMSAWPQSIARVIRRTERTAAPDAAAPVEAEPQQQELDVPPDRDLPQRPDRRLLPDRARRGRPRRARARLAGAREHCARRASTLVVPLVSQGELVGLLNLGPRLSDQDYSTDDRGLLDTLAAQAAPAVRVASSCASRRPRCARASGSSRSCASRTLIQQNFLPKELPELAGWDVAAYYRPARAVGGDFYDFIELPEDRIGIVIGDVTDKGVPAAMVMAATRSVLRASAQRVVAPGRCSRASTTAVPGHPGEDVRHLPLRGARPRHAGASRYANAGHNLPFVRTGDGSASCARPACRSA